VEEFGLLDIAYPGRLDLGLGRSSGRPSTRPATGASVAPSRVATRAAAVGATANGLRIPARFPVEQLLRSPRVGLQKTLLLLPHAESQDYGEQIADILAFLRGDYRSPDGLEAHAVPGEGADVEIWILGSSGGQSAAVAGANSLRFAANYHVSPATVLEAVEAYRSAFCPSPAVPQPYLAVSADVVVAEDEAHARYLAAGYGPWVLSIRNGSGAIPFPTPEEARVHHWSDEERALVADRIETQFVGTARQVAEQLDRLQEATGADELVITTITHDHADRVRSYRLLAQEWQS
jgi:luciferase family oxidoreductase group 1